MNAKTLLALFGMPFALVACGGSIDHIDADSGGVGGGSVASSSATSVSSSSSGGEGGSAPQPALIVSLASDTPESSTVYMDQKAVKVLRILLTATEETYHQTLRFHRTGVGSAQDIASMMLMSDSLAWAPQPLDPETHEVVFEAPTIGFAAGDKVWLDLKANFNASVSGGQHAFELSSPDAVLLQDNGLVVGDFPIVGNTFKVIPELSP